MAAVSLTAGGLLRIKNAAQVLGVSEWLVRKMAKDGELKYIQRTPRSPMLFSPSDLEGWAKRNRQ